MDRNPVARAEEAKRLLEGEVFADAFAQVEAKFVREWKEAQEQPRRELAWAKVQGLEEIQRQLSIIISRGEYASLMPDRQG